MISDAGTHTPACTATQSENATHTRLFVLDTNVILHDAGCIFNFEEHDVAIPITVLEELDRFKKGNDDIHVQARQFLRNLDQLTGDVIAEDGVSLGEAMGRFRVILGIDNDRVRSVFMGDNADHRILNTALALQNLEKEREIVLVTKDTNLRMKARAFGLKSQDYTTDKVREVDALYSGKRMVTDVPSNVVDMFYSSDAGVDDAVVEQVELPVSNENFILRNGSKSVLATYRESDRLFRRVTRTTAFGVSARNAEQTFALQALTDDSIKLVTLAGLAGSGKTLLALAAALDCRQTYRQILLARPVVALSNRDIGYLPGDVNQKLDPYMQPLWDNLTVIKHSNPDAADTIAEMQETDRIEISPLAYIRGRSLQRTFFIVDEAQNLTPHEVKTIITRAGEGTKIVLTGDIQQIDHPYLDSLSNGLSFVINRMRGQSLYAHVTLERGVRSELAEVASNLL
ncbi:MAG: PhoH family protein [Planctomycetota bacterium]|jgi:PhoH-like ATPase